MSSTSLSWIAKPGPSAPNSGITLRITAAIAALSAVVIGRMMKPDLEFASCIVRAAGKKMAVVSSEWPAKIQIVARTMHEHVHAQIRDADRAARIGIGIDPD